MYKLLEIKEYMLYFRRLRSIENELNLRWSLMMNYESSIKCEVFFQFLLIENS